MPKTTPAETIEKIHAAAAEGLNVAQIAKKCEVAWPTAKRFAGTNGRLHAEGARNHAPNSRSFLRPSRNGGHVRLKLSEELAERIWASLSLKQKARILQML